MIYFLLTLAIVLSPESASAALTSIVITEIAASKPSKQEWIEIFNTTDAAIDIANWRFVESFTASKPQGTRHKLKAIQGDSIIEPKEYAIIANSAIDFKRDYPDFSGTLIDSAWNSLREDGELIKLVDDQGSIIEGFTYIPGADGILQRIDPYLLDYSANNWQEVMGDGSPGQANAVNLEQKTVDNINQIDIVNLPLQARAGDDLRVFVNQEVIFDGSLSYNPNQGEITYLWDFDDGERARGKIVKHKFNTEGDYYVRLKVSDGKIDDEDEVKVVVMADEAKNVIKTEEITDQTNKLKNLKTKVLGDRIDKTGQAQNILQEISFQDVGQEIEIKPNKDQKKKIFKYLISTAAALVIILVGFQIKSHRKE